MRTFNKFLICMLFASMLMAGGCVNFKKLEATSFRVESVTPEGFKAIRWKADLGIDNASSEFRIYDMEGSIHLEDKELGTFSIEPVTVMARTESTYAVSGRFSIGQSVSFFGLMDMLRNAGNAGYTVDISFRIKPKGGVARKMKFKDIPVDSFIGIFR